MSLRHSDVTFIRKTGHVRHDLQMMFVAMSSAAVTAPPCESITCLCYFRFQSWLEAMRMQRSASPILL